MVLARRLMLTNIYMKFREESLNGFQVIERHDFVTEYNCKVMVLDSACRLMLIDIYMKFREGF